VSFISVLVKIHYMGTSVQRKALEVAGVEFGRLIKIMMATVDKNVEVGIQVPIAIRLMP